MKRRKLTSSRVPSASSKLRSRDLRSNAILNGLGRPEAAAVIETGTLVDLPIREQIYWPEAPINEVFFPIDSVLSVVTRMKDGSQIEVGTIGREGTSAIPLLLGGGTSANESYCQVPGQAVKIGAKLFHSLQATPKF